MAVAAIGSSVPTERELGEACELMLEFAERTGLVSGRPQQRYLWTDAFAVCNLFALSRATGSERYRRLALELVEQVHHVLGRHRPDDSRRGWISGLGEQEGERHPTRGGLRIGKGLPERPPAAAFDERLEWDRDGQYFHYLTRWMHALDQAARWTREARFNTWARELAEVAHRSFTDGPAGRSGRGMAWKMSTDLSRPLVPSMGQHDPLDGLVTCVQLRITAASLPGAPPEPSLDPALADFAGLVAAGSLVTADPLGLGGLLMDAGRVAQLVGEGGFADVDLLDALLGAALAGLPHYARQGDLRESPSRRLAFRELGLAIGMAALGVVEEQLRHGLPGGARVRARLESLAPFTKLGPAIVSFWRDPAARRTPVWAEHADINDVMLATSLVPDGVLVLAGGEAFDLSTGR